MGIIKEYLLRMFEIKVRKCLITGRIYREGECKCHAKNFGQKIDESQCSRYYFYNLLTHDMRELRT
ncbi:hypothetical protein KAR91_44610 [Candidatus Pacearchaeota archaeon]|nr:hypothetical protein [Candidatus Pacearchaeota archaeon]